MSFRNRGSQEGLKGLDVAVNVAVSIFNAIVAALVGVAIDFVIKACVASDASGFLSKHGTLVAIGVGVFLFVVLTVFVVVCQGRKLAMKTLVWMSNVSRPARIGYSLKSKTIIYRYETETKLSLEKRYEPVVEEGFFDGVADSYWWTGDGHELPLTCPRGGQSYRREISKFGPVRYKVVFTGSREFHKGDAVPEMVVRIDDIDDTNRKALLHLSTGVYEKTDLLVLRVEFPRELVVRDIRKLTYIHYTDPLYYSAEDGALQCGGSCSHHCEDADSHCYVEWRISNPIYGGKYMIEWVFPERESPLAFRTFSRDERTVDRVDGGDHGLAKDDFRTVSVTEP